MYVGLDVSLNAISVCVVDEAGVIVREGTVGADGTSIYAFIEPWQDRIVRVGLEAGPMSEWITASLIELGLPAISLEARQVKAALSAMPVKTDRNDARGIAQVVENWLVQDGACQEHRQPASPDIGRSSQASGSFDRGNRTSDPGIVTSIWATSGRRIQDKVRHAGSRTDRRQSSSWSGDGTSLAAREALMREYHRLHKLVMRAVRDDPVCRLLMTMPGIGQFQR